MPNRKDELAKINNLSNFITESELGFFLHEDEDRTVFNHYPVNVVLVDRLVNYFQFDYILLVSLP